MTPQLVYFIVYLITEDEHETLKTPSTDTVVAKTPRSRSMVVSRKSQKSAHDGSSTTRASPDKTARTYDGGTRASSRQTHVTRGPTRQGTVRSEMVSYITSRVTGDRY